MPKGVVRVPAVYHFDHPWISVALCLQSLLWKKQTKLQSVMGASALKAYDCPCTNGFPLFMLDVIFQLKHIYLD